MPCLSWREGRLDTAGRSLARRSTGTLSADPALSCFAKTSALLRTERDDHMVEIMSEMTKGFTDDDLRTFSELSFEAAAASAIPQDPADPARMQTGRALITEHRCNSLPQTRFDRPRERSAYCQPARGLSCKDTARIREQHPARLRWRPWPQCWRRSTTRRSPISPITSRDFVIDYSRLDAKKPGP